jgi:uncharacterized membrane protein YoaK (UPF0700 family)
MRPSLPVLLSFTAGYVDTAGFLALGGLFTAHVTGNFVTLGAALAHGTSGIIAKLLALPVFCLTIFLLRYCHTFFGLTDKNGLKILLAVKFVFFAAGGIAAISLAPFTDPDGLPLVLTGMLLVIGMAIQNGAHRLHLPSAPPSTMMTGTTTQIMLDLGDLAHGVTPETAATVRPRLARMAIAVAAFAIGCGLAALFYTLVGVWCFALPPFLALGSLTLAFDAPETATA